MTRSKVSSLIAKAKKKPVRDNMTTEERHALRSLQKRLDIQVIPSDKGNRVVVLSTEQYTEKVETLFRIQLTKRLPKIQRRVKRKC